MMSCLVQCFADIKKALYRKIQSRRSTEIQYFCIRIFRNVSFHNNTFARKRVQRYSFFLIQPNFFVCYKT